jgi:hypothetical protein
MDLGLGCSSKMRLSYLDFSSKVNLQIYFFRLMVDIEPPNMEEMLKSNLRNCRKLDERGHLRRYSG